MQRIITLAFALAMIAGTANAASATAGPYKLHANGKCHAAGGQFVPGNLCHAPVLADHPVCKTGVSKACGNSCIALSKTCHIK